MANTTVYPFGTDGQLPSSIGVIDDLTTGGHNDALSAEQGKVLKGIIDDAHIEDAFTSVYSTTTISVKCTVDAGYVRLPSNGWSKSVQAKRGTADVILSISDLDGAQKIVTPSGYAAGLTQAKELSSSADYIDTGWQTGTYSLVGVLDEDYPYKIFNFKRSDEGTFSSTDAENVSDGFYVECIRAVDPAMCVVDEDGDAQLNVYHAEQSPNLKVYSKDAVDAILEALPNVYTSVEGEGGTATEDEHYTVHYNKARLPNYNYDESVNANRLTISKIFTNADLADAQKMVVPTGYNAVIFQAKELSSTADYLDTGWLSGEVSLIGVFNNEYPYKVINFKTVPEASTTQTDATALESGFYIEFKRLNPAGCAVGIVDENGVGKKNIYNADDDVNVQIYTKDAIDTLFRPRAVGTPYQGERIRLETQRCNMWQVFSLSSTNPYKWKQGGAVYDKYFFQFHTDNAFIQVYDLTNGTLVQTFTMTADSNNHAGSGGFSSHFVDEDDPFPLLYQSSQDEGKVYVYRITGTVGNWSITLYQTITMPSGTDLMYMPNITIDAVHNMLVVFGYKINSWQTETNNATIVTSFNIPDPTQGDVTLSASDAMRVFTLPYIYAVQGGCAYGGVLYLAYGNTESEGGLFAISYIGGAIQSRVPFDSLGSIEPEAIGIYDGSFYFSTANNKMFKIEF